MTVDTRPERDNVEKAGAQLIHLVGQEWPGGPWSTRTLCGLDGATRDAPSEHPLSQRCIVCDEIAASRGGRIV